MGIILADNHMGFNHWHIIVLDNCTGIITYGSGASYHVGINSIYMRKVIALEAGKGVSSWQIFSWVSITLDIEVDNSVYIYHMY